MDAIATAAASGYKQNTSKKYIKIINSIYGFEVVKTKKIGKKSKYRGRFDNFLER
jgi:uncharacterized C2H2 Zn-finger protein